jgi:mRNA-degrading endonuclease toxin of MazEF toxin-antitoxin module
LVSLPVPEPGLVISYAYLWRYEHDRGLEEGRKDRPCVIVVSVINTEGKTVVSVVPVTHRKPQDVSQGIEIPQRVKKYLGLDDEKSWVMTTEINQFEWPGYDLRPVSGPVHKDTAKHVAYGYLPPALFEQIRLLILQNRVRVINRD